MLQWLVEHQLGIQKVQQVLRHPPSKTPYNGFLPITHTTEDAIGGLHESSHLHLNDTSQWFIGKFQVII